MTVSKVDFTRLSTPISNALDTDYMDIKRQVKDSPEPDLIYSNIPCHIAIKTSDNADPSSVDVQPIITSLRIHYGTWVDLKNNDYIIAKKCDLNGNILNYYEGKIGEPATSMARPFVDMAMSSARKGDEPEPVPPPEDESVTVDVHYLDETGEPIAESVTQTIRRGETVTIQPITLDNYSIDRIIVNGQEVESAIIENIQEDSTVDFYYQAVTGITSIRILVNGDYTRDDGKLAYGLHLYSPIPVLSVESSNSLKLASNKFYHNDMGNITIKLDTKFRDNLNNWHIITAEPVKVDDGYIITFADTEPVEAYECHWYG
jgi:hypothetical protein